MNDREQRGLALAALYRIEQVDGKWLVPSQSGNGEKYVVDPDRRHCTCRDHEDRAVKCKHMFAVEFVQTRETEPDGAVTVTQTFTITEKVTYKQDWPAYNKAQTREKDMFQEIMADLCCGVVEPPRAKTGRPPIPMADQVFAAAFKVYSTVSTRRFTCDLQAAAAKGYILKAPHYNSVLNALEDPALTPILKALIAESARPLASVESDFAFDSSGFSTCRFHRWFDMKYGKTMEEREWVKVHIACGVKTNVVTAVEIADKHAADSPQFGPLVRTTSQNFTIREASADSAYLSEANIELVQSVGATPYIAFKENTTGGIGGVFAKAFHYYNAFRDDFLKHYHKRSNVESTFSMIKAKFGDSVRSKSDTAMANECLCKVLNHNICCLIQSIFELGIEATFWGEAESEAESQKAIEAEPMGMNESMDAWTWV